MKQICSDLTWEQETLDALVSGLDAAGWQLVTLCDGWTVKDEICHLAYFDHTARLAATDADAFTRHIIEDLGQIKSMDEVAEVTLARGRAMATDDLMAWWRAERRQLMEALAALSPRDRLPWYGPPMSALSFATARLMETWAHGQDIYDVLKRRRPVSPGLRHIAHLGVKTFGWSFSNRGLDVPDTPVHVALTAPSGESWTWGEETAAESVRGPAEDFCLVVTQRRHVDDTALVCTGETARRWMLVAQAFAGPPDNGPPAGTFA
ncbi:MAG TPA: TIGR03084 family protein [Desulfobacteraceae bacterium]|nr:TIGR03084 family protein [Deltaproteobacteria bacterium]HDI60463.1 TIGR03084 family protein [Desulfobacteraceae bacterium]